MKVIRLIDKNISIVTITAFPMFKKLEERLSMLSRDKEDTKKVQFKFLEMKTIISLMKNM